MALNFYLLTVRQQCLVTVITRKAYGGAYDVMSSKHLRGDFNMHGPLLKLRDGSKNTEIIHRSDLGNKQIAQHTADYEKRFANPFVARSVALSTKLYS